MEMSLDAIVPEGQFRPARRKRFNRTCQECGAVYEARARHGEFCGPDCRKAFNNRRMKRGAEIYDLFMTLRYERTLANRLKVWGLLCRMALGFRMEDERERNGRKSWQPAREVLARRPDLKAEVISTSNAGSRRK